MEVIAYDDTEITFDRFLDWSYVGEIHRSLVFFPHKGPLKQRSASNMPLLSQTWEKSRVAGVMKHVNVDLTVL